MNEFVISPPPPKIFIASPAFDGKVNVQFAVALAQTTIECATNGVGIQYQLNTSGSLLCAERNRLIQAFLESNSTHVLFIDSDLGWPARAVLALLAKNVPFVAGVYPTRREHQFLFRPCTKEDGSLVVDCEKNLLKMEYIPAGFMLIQRNVIETLIEKNPHLKFVPKDEKAPSGYALFNTELWEGEFWGEDYVFCRHVRNAGYDIWVDPLIQFDHCGNIGMLAEVLTNNSAQAVSKDQAGGE